MTISLPIEDIPALLVMVIVAALVGYIADLFTGGRVPLGFLGTILFGVLGAWVATKLIHPRIPVTMPSEPVFDGVLLVTAAIGALVFSLLWCIFASRLAGR
jgi:uncharacterized membrane protein YeaQ/YmgE (transglycosylase-associated protein family)